MPGIPIAPPGIAGSPPPPPGRELVGNCKTLLPIPATAGAGRGARTGGSVCSSTYSPTLMRSPALTMGLDLESTPLMKVPLELPWSATTILPSLTTSTQWRLETLAEGSTTVLPAWRPIEVSPSCTG